MKIALLPAAISDIEEGHDFYEKQEPGAGSYFQESVFSEIESLPQYASIQRLVHGHRRWFVSRFPYAIYYTLENDVLTIRRILDCRRNPSWTRRQLK